MRDDRAEGHDPRSSCVTFAPDSSASRQARCWIAGVLCGWPDETVERARLIVSELVTNAVLHARTEVSLRCEHDLDHVRVEVGDGQRSAPVAKRHVAVSSTGQGMRLVSALAESWGAERAGGGQVVWFTLARDMLATVHAAAGPEVLAAVPGDPMLRVGPAGDAPGGLGAVQVQILGFPLGLSLEVEQHNDAVLRELDLMERSESHRPEVPFGLRELVASVRTFTATDAIRARVDGALRGHREVTDLVVDVPAVGWRVLLEVVAQLDELDRLCRDGTLLTVAAPARQRRFRHWYADQVAGQMQGMSPTPWDEGPT